MNKHSHPELDGQESQPLYTFELKSQHQKHRDRLIWIAVGALVGAGLSFGSYLTFIHLQSEPLSLLQGFYKDHINPQPAESAAFQKGIEKAMQAAEETQHAEFREDWVGVAMLWQGAIAHMREVPSSEENYSVARQKAKVYERNLQYAQSNVETREAINPDLDQFWSLGSDRSTVMAVEGIPSRVSRFDALCQEIMYYENSRVELLNGQVNKFDNTSNNLSVLPSGLASPLIFKGDRTFWTLGSSRNDVVRIEGSPSRMSQYEFSGTEILYYENGWVELEDDRVIGYQNRDNKLQVAIAGLEQNPSKDSTGWTLGSSRDELLQVQHQTPTQVSRNNAQCEETIHYGLSSVTLKHGVVTGYDNSAKNLNVN